MDKWKTVEPGTWKPEKVGEKIMGVLVNKEPKDEQTGLSARYYLDDGKEIWRVWGCAVIDDRMQYVKTGDKVRMTYEGKTKNKRNQDVNLFKVEVAERPEDDSRIVEESDNEPAEIAEIT